MERETRRRWETGQGLGSRKWSGSHRGLGARHKNFSFSSEPAGSGARGEFEQRRVRKGYDFVSKESLA